MKKTLRVLLALGCLLLSACGSDTGLSSQERETLFQASANRILYEGNYAGVQTITEFKKKGDFGIGLFAELDGEIILLDGVLYQVKEGGKIERPPDTGKLTFSMITTFEPDVTQDIGPISNLAAFKAVVDPLIENKDAFYAIRVDGTFAYIQARTLPKQQKPYPPLNDIILAQPRFEFNQIEGTLVGFWCPDYVGQLNSTGYHLHFISKDRSLGGHVYELAITSGKIQLDRTWFFKTY